MGYGVPKNVTWYAVHANLHLFGVGRRGLKHVFAHAVPVQLRFSDSPEEKPCFEPMRGGGWGTTYIC